MLGTIAAAWVGGVLFANSARLAARSNSSAALIGLLVLSVVLARVATERAPLRARGWRVVFGCFACFGGCCATFVPTQQNDIGAHPPLRASGVAELCGRVAEARYGVDYAEVRIEDATGVWVDPPGTWVPAAVSLRLALADEPAPRSTVCGVFELTARSRFRNPVRIARIDSGSTYKYSARQVAGSLLHVMHEAPHLFRTVHRLRKLSREHMSRTLPSRTAGLVRAVVLGDGASLERDTREFVADSGLAHLLAVSGLHITMLCGMLVAFIRFVLCRTHAVANPTRVAALLGVPACALYCVFTGATPSAVRASVSTCLIWLLVGCGRAPSPASALGAATCALAVLSPSLVTRPAYLLSVMATVAIVCGPRIPRATGSLGYSAWRWLRVNHQLSVRTLAATAPILGVVFHNVAWVAWLTNLVVLPLASAVLMPLANAYALLTPVLGANSTLTSWFALAMTHSSDAFLEVCAFVARRVTPAPWPSLTSHAVAAIAISLWVYITSRSRAAVVASMTIAIVVVAGDHAVERARTLAPHVTFVDVGQGDASVLRDHDSTAVIDTGPGAFGASDALLDVLHDEGVTTIDILIVTHAHPDHYGGLHAIGSAFEVRELWIPEQAHVEEERGTFIDVVRTLESRGTRVRFENELCASHSERSPARLGGSTLSVLWPCPSYDPGLGYNDNSIVVRWNVETHRVLFTGDIEHDAERALVTHPSHALHSDVLKVAHHGSLTSSTPEFLHAVGASIAVVSAGVGNRFKHPRPEVLIRLAKQGRVYRTDVDGGTQISFARGVPPSIRTWRAP